MLASYLFCIYYLCFQVALGHIDDRNITLRSPDPDSYVHGRLKSHSNSKCVYEAMDKTPSYAWENPRKVISSWSCVSLIWTGDNVFHIIPPGSPLTRIDVPPFFVVSLFLLNELVRITSIVSKLPKISIIVIKKYVTESKNKHGNRFSENRQIYNIPVYT
jgi:hypothetical protein